MYDSDAVEGERRILCDVCREIIGPKTPFCSLPIYTAWGGAFGQGMAICVVCMRRMTGNIQPESDLLGTAEGGKHGTS